MILLILDTLLVLGIVTLIAAMIAQARKANGEMKKY
jgi:hypothetical protein